VLSKLRVTEQGSRPNTRVSDAQVSATGAGARTMAAAAAAVAATAAAALAVGMHVWWNRWTDAASFQKSCAGLETRPRPPRRAAPQRTRASMFAGAAAAAAGG